MTNVFCLFWGSKKSIFIRSALVIFLIAGVLFVYSCSITPNNTTNISLGEAIALSQSNSFSQVVVDTSGGAMSMTVASIQPETIPDINGNQIQINSGSS